MEALMDIYPLPLPVITAHRFTINALNMVKQPASLTLILKEQITANPILHGS